MSLLAEALRADKMKPCVQDMTVLNLVEITRKKRGRTYRRCCMRRARSVRAAGGCSRRKR